MDDLQLISKGSKSESCSFTGGPQAQNDHDKTGPASK